MKCKATRAVVLVRQREPLCKGCLEAGICGKVRAIKTHKLLLPNDHIAVAFSGGSSSQALLTSVLPMRKDAGTPRKERGKIEFQLSVIHINEAAAHGLDRRAAAEHAAAVAAAAAACGAAPPAATVHVVPLADVFLLPPPPPGAGGGEARWGGLPLAEADGKAAGGAGDGGLGQALARLWSDGGGDGAGEGALREGSEAEAGAGAEAEAEAREARLRVLLQSVPDPTGREDLLVALRGRLLAAVAARLGASKLLRADTATALAARVIADTAKGRGYSLPGDIQLVDARGLGAGEPALLYPMREVTLKEAVYVCRLRGLRPAELPSLPAASGSRRSLNDLSHAFVSGLQASLPSTVFTVLRTAAALRPFPFNALDTIAPPAPAPRGAAAPVRAAAGAVTPAAAAAAETSAEAAAEADAAMGAGPVSAPAVASSSNNSNRSTCGGGGGTGTCRPPAVACCALCRAPLSQRERDAIAAARAEAAATGAGQGGLRAGSGAEDGEAGGRGCEPGTTGAEAGDGGDSSDDLAAPFCTSCRSQVLFTPGQTAKTGGAFGALRSGVGRAGDSVAGSRCASKVLPLLPAALGGPGR